MKRIGVALLVGAGLVVFWAGNRGQAQDPGGGVLKTPFADPGLDNPPLNPGPLPTVNPGATTPRTGSAQQLFSGNQNSTTTPLPNGMPLDTYQLVLEKLKPNPNLTINRDIVVNPQVGPWMIQLTYYQGPEGPQMAREMVAYLRSDPNYKLPAYVFNFGAEEKQKEYERVQKSYAKYKEALAKQKESLAGSEEVVYSRPRVPYVRVEEQVAVLVGGYRDENAARSALEVIRKFKPPDPTKVKLSMIFGAEKDPKDRMNLKMSNAEVKYLSPFRTAWVARNPSTKSDRPMEKDGLDLEALKKYNADEPFTLLQCKKPYTLVVKVIQVPTAIQARNERSPLEIVGMLKSGERVDVAAQSGHSLAGFLRKGKLEAYVLHTQFSSIVSVGQFDSLEDPHLLTMLNTLPARLRAEHNGKDIVQFLPRPVPMEVPGVKTATVTRGN